MAKIDDFRKIQNFMNSVLLWTKKMRFGASKYTLKSAKILHAQLFYPMILDRETVWDLGSTYDWLRKKKTYSLLGRLHSIGAVCVRRPVVGTDPVMLQSNGKIGRDGHLKIEVI